MNMKKLTICVIGAAILIVSIVISILSTPPAEEGCTPPILHNNKVVYEISNNPLASKIAQKIPNVDPFDPDNDDDGDIGSY
jgi:hypothetical protein